MAANDVGSLLVYDKDKAGPKGDIPQTVDACVGIITERGGSYWYGGLNHETVTDVDAFNMSIVSSKSWVCFKTAAVLLARQQERHEPCWGSPCLHGRKPVKSRESCH
jgi:hypothetical protein